MHAFCASLSPVTFSSSLQHRACSSLHTSAGTNQSHLAMGIVKGGALRLFQTFLYALAFCCSAVILGIYSYFLSVLADRNLRIPSE